jgi:membrane carboxypeptidase/penicillin-binding protein
VEAASRRYFGRGAAALSMDQAALLVATLPHPLTSNPSYRAGRTYARQQLILRKLRGERVVVLPEAGEDSLPVALPPTPDKTVPLDSALRDSMARPDTTLHP